MRCAEDRAAVPFCPNVLDERQVTSSCGPLSPALSHQEARLHDLCVWQILWSKTPSPTPGHPQAGVRILKGYFKAGRRGAQAKVVSAPSGMSEWVAKGTGGQTGGQTERCQGNEEKRVAWAGKRAPGPRPPNLLATFPALLESGKTHPVCLGDGQMAFLKNSFL